MENAHERREHRREPTLLPGVAVTDEGLRRIELRIVNLSRAGALVELNQVTTMPDRFVLLFNHTAEPCQLIWQRGALAGLAFCDFTFAD